MFMSQMGHINESYSLPKMSLLLWVASAIPWAPYNKDALMPLLQLNNGSTCLGYQCIVTWTGQLKVTELLHIA